MYHNNNQTSSGNNNNNNRLANQISRNRIQALEKEVLHLRTLVAAHNQTLVESHRILNLGSQILANDSHANEQLRRLGADLVNVQRKIPRILDAQQAMFKYNDGRQQQKKKRRGQQASTDREDSDDNDDGESGDENEESERSRNDNMMMNVIDTREDSSSSGAMDFGINDNSNNNKTSALESFSTADLLTFQRNLLRASDQTFKNWCRDTYDHFQSVLETPSRAFEVFQETPSEDALQDFMESFETAKESLFCAVDAELIEQERSSPFAASTEASAHITNEFSSLIEGFLSSKKKQHQQSSSAPSSFAPTTTNNIAHKKPSTLVAPTSNRPKKASSPPTNTTTNTGRNTLQNLQYNDDDYENENENDQLQPNERYFHQFQSTQKPSSAAPYEIKPIEFNDDNNNSNHHKQQHIAGSGSNVVSSSRQQQQQQQNNSARPRGLNQDDLLRQSRGTKAAGRPTSAIDSCSSSNINSTTASSSQQQQPNLALHTNNPLTPTRYRPDKNASSSIDACMTGSNYLQQQNVGVRTTRSQQQQQQIQEDEQPQAKRRPSPSSSAQQQSQGRLALLQWQQQQLEMQLYSQTGGSGGKATGSEAKFYALNKKLQKIRSEILKEQRAESEVSRVQSEVVQQKQAREADRRMFGR